jgi:exopolyphosphatase/guanosine-5'-triphosphate,3'-diphosphate pyrophosphatase
LLNAELDLAHIKTLVLSGSDVRIVAEHTGKDLNENTRIIDRKDFIAFADKINQYNIKECVENLKISYTEADGLLPGILAAKLFLEQTGAAQVVVPQVTIREGLLIDLAQGIDSTVQEGFFSQIMASAVSLGKKYHIDEAHSRHVAKSCNVLFDALVKEHGMNSRHRMLLEIAAILHDIGMFIKVSGHQRHGQYIVTNSEIFGLQKEETKLIANVIRYHRKDKPSELDFHYISLGREERMLVLKMASILRIADAMDRGHSQHIKHFTVERRHETVVLHVENVLDLTHEVLGVEEKGGLFQDVFGYKVVFS